MEPVKLWRFALFYGGVRLVLLAVGIAAVIFFPILEKSNTGMSFAVEFGAVLATHYRFIQKTGREIEPFEYWPLVFRCFAVSMAFQLPWLLLWSYSTTAPTGVVVFAFAFGTVLSLAVLAFGFRSSIGRPIAKGLEKSGSGKADAGPL